MSQAPVIYSPLLMTVKTFASLNEVSESMVRQCIAGTSTAYPPLRAKRTRGGQGRLYITAEAAAEWRAALADA